MYHDLKSVTFDNKQLTKTIQKSLFKTNEQLHDFEIIVSELINDKNLDKALKNVHKVYEIKRKIILFGGLGENNKKINDLWVLEQKMDLYFWIFDGFTIWLE